MKCCKCNAEIPDQSRFCMVCGAEQTATRHCQACGEELPEEAVFCPYCGKHFSDSPKAGPAVPKDARDLFFPIQGITLGKTTKDEAKRLGKKVEVDFYSDFQFKAKCEDIGGYMIENGPTFEFKDHSYTANHMYFMSPKYDFPEEWIENLNLSPEMTLNEWSVFFKGYGFSVNEVHHDSGFMKGTDTLHATSNDGHLHFYLIFTSKKALGQVDVNYK